MRPSRFIADLATFSALGLLLVACAAAPGATGPDGGVVSCVGLEDRSPCDDGNPCTQNDRCSAEVCLAEPIDDERPCDDGTRPPVLKVCRLGACTAVATPPGDGGTGDGGPPRDAGSDAGMGDGGDSPDVPTPSCSDFDTMCLRGEYNTTIAACVQVPREDGTPCDDGNVCTTGESCTFGLCGGGAPVAAETACDDGNLCTSGDICQAGRCAGTARNCQTAALACNGVCDPASGACVAGASPDGSACNDRNACTTGEVCSAGVCGGGVNTCFCANRADGTPCDDGQACTSQDACSGGQCVGAPVLCNVLDDLCNVGICDPASGRCAASPRPAGTPCFDGSLCTEGDACFQGVCRGTPKDCSAFDSACTRGVCDPDTAECGSRSYPNRTPCDDGSACTGHDACVGGVCRGQSAICAPCIDSVAGAVCDDGDPCTSDDRCAEFGETLLCLGTPQACTTAGGQCTAAVCDFANGRCAEIPRPDGTACADGDSCTGPDACDAGACRAAAIDTCGVEVALCEAQPEENVTPAPTVLPASSEPFVVLGRVDVPGQTDWYALDLTVGQEVALETAPNCGSHLDTLLALYAPGIEIPIASDEDGGDGAFSRIPRARASRDGRYLVSVTSYAASGVGSYLLRATTVTVDECASDADCGCAQRACRASERGVKRCVPALPMELEPNDSPEAPQPLELEVAVAAAIDVEGDMDVFAVQLFAGQPIGVETRAFCGSTVGSSVEIRAGDTLEVLASGTYAEGELFAQVRQFVAPRDGTYLVVVEEPSLATGAYVVSVRDLSCAADDGCACADDRCVREGDALGVCQPRAAVREEGGGPAPTLTLGERTHAVIDYPSDRDTFVASLQPGTYRISTTSYCGSAVDTRLELVDPTGMTVLATNDDGTAPPFSELRAVRVTTAGVYRIRVSAIGAHAGEYIIVVATDAP